MWKLEGGIEDGKKDSGESETFQRSLVKGGG